jgi:hypothetical protein
MTLILMLATFAVLTFLGLSCRRARLELEEQMCDCLHPAVPAAVGFGAGPLEIGPVGPVLTRIDGGREGACAPGAHGRRHLRVVGAR